MQERRARQADAPYYRRTGFIAAAVFVLAVLAAGAVLIITSLGGDGAEPSPPPPISEPTDTGPTGSPTADPTTTPEPTTDAPETGDVSACPDLGPGSGEEALTTPPEVQWSPVGEVSAAVSENDGPAVVDGVKRCFANSAAGALLAAYNFAADARVSSLSPVEVANMRMVDGSAEQAEFIQLVENETPNTSSVVVEGYRFIETSADRYVISLAQRFAGDSTPLYFLDRITVEWRDGDWYVREVATLQQVDATPSDYVGWGPHHGRSE